MDKFSNVSKWFYFVLLLLCSTLVVYLLDIMPTTILLLTTAIAILGLPIIFISEIKKIREEKSIRVRERKEENFRNGLSAILVGLIGVYTIFWMLKNDSEEKLTLLGLSALLIILLLSSVFILAYYKHYRAHTDKLIKESEDKK